MPSNYNLTFWQEKYHLVRDITVSFEHFDGRRLTISDANTQRPTLPQEFPSGLLQSIFDFKDRKFHILRAKTKINFRKKNSTNREWTKITAILIYNTGKRREESEVVWKGSMKEKFQTFIVNKS